MGGILCYTHHSLSMVSCYSHLCMCMSSVFNEDVWCKRKKTRWKLRWPRFKSWFSQLCDLGQITEHYWAPSILHTSWILNTSKVIMNLSISCRPLNDTCHLLLNPQFLLVYTYCFNKNVSRFTTEILWEKRTETWEKSGALFSIDVSFYAKVECLYHNDYMLLHTLLWPFPNRGRENLPSPGKLIFIKVSRLDILAYFMVSWFKLVFFKDYTTYFLLKEYITCTM